LQPPTLPPRRLLAPPLEFYEAIQGLRIIIIVVKADALLAIVILFLAASRASQRLVVVSKFRVVVIATV